MNPLIISRADHDKLLDHAPDLLSEFFEAGGYIWGLAGVTFPNATDAQRFEVAGVLLAVRQRVAF